MASTAALVDAGFLVFIFAKATLATLAGLLYITGITTVDCRDFAANRVGDGQSFERLWL